MVDLSVELFGQQFKNPVWSASGCFGYGRELEAFFDPSRLGAVITKGISLLPRAGNKPPRVVETPAGMLNSIGLENVGLERFLTEKLPELQKLNTKVIVNFLGDTVEEYVQLAETLSNQEVIAALEMNLSCPNVAKGGLVFGSDPKAAAEAVAAVRRVCKKPLIVKLSPNVTDITEVARAVEDAGADAVSLINTLLGMAIDPYRRRPILGNVVGGLSGPAIKPVALRMVYQTAQAVKIPVIGIGGISSATDVVEFLLAGATAVQVGTAALVDPTVFVKLLNGLEQFCTDQGVKRIVELIGALTVE